MISKLNERLLALQKTIKETFLPEILTGELEIKIRKETISSFPSLRIYEIPQGEILYAIIKKEEIKFYIRFMKKFHSEEIPLNCDLEKEIERIAKLYRESQRNTIT